MIVDRSVLGKESKILSLPITHVRRLGNFGFFPKPFAHHFNRGYEIPTHNPFDSELAELLDDSCTFLFGPVPRVQDDPELGRELDLRPNLLPHNVRSVIVAS
jgi:hypothetical protein